MNYSIHIIFGYRCNLKCPYCYVKIDREKNSENIEYNKIKKVLRLIETLCYDGSCRISLEGGEPLLYETSVCAFLKGLIDKGITPKEITLITNGTMYSDTLSETLRKFMRKGTKVTIAISAHYVFKSDLFWKNVENYIRFFGIDNVHIVYVDSIKKDKSFKKMLENLLYIKKRLFLVVKEIDPIKAYKILSNPYPHIAINTDITESSETNLKVLANRFGLLVAEFFSNYVQEYNPSEVIEGSKIDLCGAMKRWHYIVIYPTLEVGPCPFIPYTIYKTSRYFKRLTVEDIISNPSILQQSPLSKRGQILSKIAISLLRRRLKGMMVGGFCLAQYLFNKNGRFHLNKGLSIFFRRYYYDTLKSIYFASLRTFKLEELREIPS